MTAMRYQLDPAWCGPTAIQNAARALGIKLGAKVVAEACKTTAEGTDAPEMIAAMAILGLYPVEFGTQDKEAAAEWLMGSSLGPLIISVDSWNHWVTVIGACGPRVILIDSEQCKANRNENGVHALAVQTVLKRWRAGRKTAGKEPRFYGMRVYNR